MLLRILLFIDSNLPLVIKLSRFNLASSFAFLISSIITSPKDFTLPTLKSVGLSNDGAFTSSKLKVGAKGITSCCTSPTIEKVTFKSPPPPSTEPCSDYT